MPDKSLNIDPSTWTRVSDLGVDVYQETGYTVPVFDHGHSHGATVWALPALDGSRPWLLRPSIANSDQGMEHAVTLLELAAIIDPLCVAAPSPRQREAIGTAASVLAYIQKEMPRG